MIKLHVLTAVSRPDNLCAVAESLIYAHRLAPTVDLTWHCRFDLLRTHTGGQALKNAMLDDIPSGWVWVLDDDTVVHEGLIRAVQEIVALKPKLCAIVFSQLRTDGRVLEARPRNVTVNFIDMGQAVISRELIGDTRIPESYAGDGEFLSTLLRRRANVFYSDAVLSLHNALSGIDKSE